MVCTWLGAMGPFLYKLLLSSMVLRVAEIVRREIFVAFARACVSLGIENPLPLRSNLIVDSGFVARRAINF